MAPAGALLVVLMVGLMTDGAAAFQQPWMASLQRRNSILANRASLLCTRTRLSLREVAGAQSCKRCRSPYGLQGMHAQADLVGSIVSGASSLSGAVVLCGVIAFHELGHFLAAKVQGIRISDFSIGFGPKVFGFKDADGITYNFRLFPLGGFVSFPEGIEDEEGKEGEQKKDKSSGTEPVEDDDTKYNFDDPDLIQNRPALQRALVISSGVIFNMILSYSAIFISVVTIGLSTPVISPGVAVPGIADPNGAAARAGLVQGDVIMQVNGKDVLSGDDATRMVCVCVCVCVCLREREREKEIVCCTYAIRLYSLAHIYAHTTQVTS